MLTTFVLAAMMPQVKTLRLESLPINVWRTGYSVVQRNRSLGRRPLKTGGTVYERGLGANAPLMLRLGLDGHATRFQGVVWIDDDANKGSIAARIEVDGKTVWKTPRLTKGSPSVPFDVKLTNAHEVQLLVDDGQDGAGDDHVNVGNPTLEYTGEAPKPLPFVQRFNLNIDEKHQMIDGFGASDCWNLGQLDHWSKASREKLADLLFSPTKGAGLTQWRFVLGGGINNETIAEPWRSVPTFETAPGKYDWNVAAGRQWFLHAAKERGVNQFIAFACSPPMRLTRNGFTNTSETPETTNLKAGAEGEYAKYLADILDHFVRTEKIPFTQMSPINEPDFEWLGIPGPGSQEGNRASVDDIARVNKSLAQELTARKLPVQLLTPEASSPSVAYHPAADWMGRKYKGNFGNYLSFFAANHQLQDLNAIYGYHSYWADSFDHLFADRVQLRKSLDKIPGVKAWQTEYCQMEGPHHEGGGGRDLSMTLALNVARIMHFDLTVVEASAWQWWLAISPGDYKDGLIYVDDPLSGSEQIYPSKNLYAIGQFSRFVRPGMRRVGLHGPDLSMEGLFASAYTDGKKLVVVFVNSGNDPEVASLPGVRLSSGVEMYRTSDRPGEDIKRIASPKDLESIDLAARSVTTLVMPAR